jgi:hypothetical protein
VKSKLFYNTIAATLHYTLKVLMRAEVFKEFRLVGGTPLSLYRGHRAAVGIDLFTDEMSGSVDFEKIDTFLKYTYPYLDYNNSAAVEMGRSYYVGSDERNCIKLDVFYTDKFIQQAIVMDTLRLASVEEIISMKINAILRGGRKKDFWDVHELMDEYSLEKMLALHKEKYPDTHDERLIRKNFINFATADVDFDPICLRNKHWEIIKLDIIDFVKS